MSLVYALTSSPSYASSLASTYDAYAFALPDLGGGGKSIAQGCPFVVGFTA